MTPNNEMISSSKFALSQLSNYFTQAELEIPVLSLKVSHVRAII